MISEDQIKLMMPSAGARLTPHLPYIVPALDAADITSPDRIAAFLAQLAHESGEFRYMEEIADGSAYDITVNPGKALELGNTSPGDGMTYKGHGPIQVTGKANHADCGRALGLDLINNPKLITEPQYGTLSATWYWNSRELSKLADVGWFKEITRRINGGFNGLEDRLVYWRRNRNILGLPYIEVDDERANVKAFQAAHGLTPDGAVGPRTMAALA